MSAPPTPTADAGKDAWNDYNARVMARQEAKQVATERHRQHVKESKFIKRISRLVPASWLSGNGGNGGSSDASRGKYKPAPPASGSEDATGGFGGGGGGSGSGSGSGVGAAAGPPGVEKKE